MNSAPRLSTPLAERLVRYAELIPCTNAFIDARSPGSDQKENFTIIGPGVAENPRQHVHICEPHGFNIGAARQPPGCTNSLHSHDSAEVFIIHTGTWRFFWGEHGDAGEVVLYPGDTISIPIHVFRGFENVGEDVGFMFAVLGGDDPGRVHWAPHVIEKARDHGLVLLESGRLVDTTLGESIPVNEAAVRPSRADEIAYIRVPTAAEMFANVARSTSLVADHTSPLNAEGVNDAAVILADAHGMAPISSAHGFTVRRLTIKAGARSAAYSVNASEVLLVHRGRLDWHAKTAVALGMGNEACVALAAGDTFSAPANTARWLEASDDAEVFIVRPQAAVVATASLA
ncbi:MAG: cupin [Burkholderiales bacterium]